MSKVLFITSSARDDSLSTALGQRLVNRIPGAIVTRRDVGRNPPPAVDQAWVGANFTPADKRSPEQIAKLALSTALVTELKQADVIVLSVAVYNLSIPSALKSYIDLVVRAGETFKYGASGPEGLLSKQKVYIVVASGGTPVGSPYDFATPYLKGILGFIGLTPVVVGGATSNPPDKAAESKAAAEALIDAVAL